jgi:RimJ/RimL family protein N-acetyltransferase
MILKGKNVNLRSLTLNDAESLQENANEELISNFTRIPHPYNLDHAKSFIKDCIEKEKEKTSYQFGIEYESKIVGMVGLSKVNNKGNKNAELGYWIGKDYRGKGFTKEAVKLILDFAFKKLKLERVQAKVMHPNIISAKLLEKYNFKLEGRGRKANLIKNEWQDDLYYGLLKEEY